MNISSSFSPPVTSGINNKPIAPIKNSERVVESAPKVEQEQSPNTQTQPSIVIDEQAIALFEQNQASQSASAQPSENSFSSASQDQPSAKNETAIASYQAVGNLSQRESVQQLFGVDLFA